MFQLPSKSTVGRVYWF